MHPLNQPDTRWSVVLLLLLLFCFQQTTCFTLTGIAEAENRSVGVIVPLSGTMSSFGQAFRNGLQMAERELSGGSSNCRVVIEDSQYDSRRTLAAFRKLIENDRVAYTYAFGGPMADVIIPQSERLGHLFFTSETESRFAEGTRYVVRFVRTSREYVRPMIAELRDRGFRRISIVRTENQFLDGIYQAIVAELPKNVELSEVAVLQPDDMDLRSAVLKLKSQTFDTVGLLIFPSQLQIAYRVLQELRVEGDTFALDSLESAELRKASLPKVAGALYTSYNAEESFAHRYETNYRSRSQLAWAALGYEFRRMINEIGCKSSPAQLMERLRSYRSPESVIGTFHYVETENGDRYFNVPNIVKQVLPDGNVQIVRE